MAWVSPRKWYLAVRYSYGQTKQKRSLNNVGQVNPEDCYLSRKDSGLQGRDIQVVNPYKWGWRGPAGRLTNVWNGHPAAHAQEEAMPLVEWTLTPMGHSNPKEEYANVIAFTNHLEILCFVTGPPLARLPKPTKSCSKPWFQDRIPGKQGWQKAPAGLLLSWPTPVLTAGWFSTRVLWGSRIAMVQMGAPLVPLVRLVSPKVELYEDAGD